MPRLFTTSSQAGSLPMHNLRITTATLPQVVFATTLLGTIKGFVLSLYNLPSQVCALWDLVFYRLFGLFIHTVHIPNSNYYKGD